MIMTDDDKHIGCNNMSNTKQCTVTLDSILSEIEMEIAQRNRSGSVNSRDAVVGTSSGSPVGSAPNSNTENKLENQLYDKYLAK